jgi:hypothetical protein
MKLKKFFAGVLAAAMMLTVGATAAFATTPDTISVKKDGSETDAKMFTESDDDLVLTKTLHVVKGTAPDSMTFSFTVVKQGETTAINGAASNAVFTATQDEPFVGPNKDYTATTTVQLATVLGNNKDKVGEYSYTITESTPAYPGVTPVDSTLTMKITVVNQLDEQKQPIANSYGYYVALYRGGNKIEAKDAFKNSYDSKSLTLSKTVHGALADLNKDFTFTIKFTKDTGVDANNLYMGPQVGTLGTNVSIKPEGTATTPLAANTYLELDKPYTVSLRHNGSLELSNLPTGIKYEVFENGSEVSGSDVVLNTTNTSGQNVKYVVTVEDADQNAVTFSGITVSGQINKESPANVTTAFHNTNNAEPDMGVVLDNAPYIAMLAIVAIGGVALMLNKRRRDEE